MSFLNKYQHLSNYNLNTLPSLPSRICCVTSAKPPAQWQMGKSTANPKLPNHHFPDLEIIKKGFKKNQKKQNQPSQISSISSHCHGCCRSWELSIPCCSGLESTPRARQPQAVIPHGQTQEAKQSCTRSPGRDSDHPGCRVNYLYTSPAPVLEQIFASPWAFCPFTLLLTAPQENNTKKGICSPIQAQDSSLLVHARNAEKTASKQMNLQGWGASLSSWNLTRSSNKFQESATWIATRQPENSDTVGANRI